MNTTISARPKTLGLSVLLTIAVVIGLFVYLIPPAYAHGNDRDRRQPKATIVLEHGAWADASSWNEVIPILQHEGYTVYAPPNPLRGIKSDAEVLSDFLKTIPGPIVLVGHSYGGAVITNAATGNPNVKALVYIDGFIPKQGDTIFGLTFAQPGSCLDAALSFNFVTYPGAAPTDFDTYLKVGANGAYQGFAKCFANGIDPDQAALLAVGQRPLALSAGQQESGVPAWQTIPSWALVGTQDNVIPPAELTLMATNAHSHIEYVRAGHLSMISHPHDAAHLIEEAVRATN